MNIAKRYRLKVIEDNAQALGAVYKGQGTGSIGDAGCISFFPTKNLGAFGDGGMIVTNDEEFAEKVRLLRVHGAKPKYYHKICGCNSRLDEIQAAILIKKFTYIDKWNQRRREIASLYNKIISSSGANELIITPKEPEYAYSVYHQYTLCADKRDELQAYLKQRGIGTTVYYPLPLHMQEVFKNYGYKKGDIPLSEEACSKVLSLPMFPELNDCEIEYVAAALIEYINRQ